MNVFLLSALKTRKLNRMFRNVQGRFRQEPVENLHLSTTQSSLGLGTKGTPCESLLNDMKARALENQPHFEVTKDPFNPSSYIARMTSLTHPVSVFEPIPIEIFADDDRTDLSVYWHLCRKRLKANLVKAEKALN